MKKKEEHLEMTISLDAYQRKLWLTKLHKINLKDVKRATSDWNQAWMRQIGFWMIWTLACTTRAGLVKSCSGSRSSKTFNPYKSHVSRTSHQGSHTGLLSARSLLTSLKWFLHHNHPQSKHSLQAGSKKGKRGVGGAITTSKSSLFTETTEGEIKGDPCLSGLWPFPVRGWEWGSA